MSKDEKTKQLLIKRCANNILSQVNPTYYDKWFSFVTIKLDDMLDEYEHHLSTELPIPSDDDSDKSCSWCGKPKPYWSERMTVHCTHDRRHR